MQLYSSQKYSGYFRGQKLFILMDAYVPRYQTQGGLFYLYLNFSTLPVQ